MSIKKYLIYCEPCGYKRITDGTDDHNIVKISRSSVPSGIPKLNFETKKIETKKDIKQPILVKCPKCGRGIRIKKNK